MNKIKEKLSCIWEYYLESFPLAEKTNKPAFYIPYIFSGSIYMVIIKRLEGSIEGLLNILFISISIFAISLHVFLYHKIEAYEQRIKNINNNILLLFFFIFPIYLSIVITFLLKVFSG